jgi:cytoskeleton protein RodZ
MNPIQAPSPDEQNVVDFAESPGRRLRVLRQTKGWEIERIATQLHLRPHLVEALEQDRFHELPGPVFVMGYLRNYARLLGIDPEPLIGAYRAATPSQEAHAAWTSHPAKPEVGSGHILVRLVSLGLFLAVIAMLVLWWQNRPEPPDEPTLGSESPGLPLLAEDELSDGGIHLDEPGTTDDLSVPGDRAPGSQPQEWGPPAATIDSPAPIMETDRAALGAAGTPPAEALDPGAQPAPSPVETAAASPEAAPEGLGAAPKPPEVVLSFSGTSWIDVRDAAGKVVLTGEMRKGDRRVLSGQPPFSFVIGNAKAAAVTVGDKPLDLSTRGRSGVARFKLDPDNPE